MRWIPNALTILRVLLIPVFIWLIFFSPAQNHVAWALLVFVVAAFTDFLDGYLARKWRVISDFGKIADPLADKLLVLSALAALTWLEPYRLFVAIFIVIALREVVITILREVHKKKGIIMPADKLGKWKTFLQMTGIIIFFALWAWLPEVPRFCVIAANIWFGLVALLTLYSGLNYFKPLPTHKQGGTMKHTGLLLTFLLLLALTACSSDKQQQNNYHKFDDLMDNSKPIAFGEERDVFIFAEGQNLERVATVLDSSLAREIQMTVGESLFQPISIDFDQLDEYRKYKNLIFCGTLDGSDSVSAYLRETLASDLVETARASGGELFVVNNLHVRDQIILYLLAKDTPSLEELARQRSDQIFRYLADRFSQRQGYQAYRLSVYGDKFYEDWPFSIQVPVSFRPFKEDKKDGFLSFIHQPANPTRNLPDKYVSVYYEAMPQNSIDEKWLHDKRQELGTKYLNGDEILRYTAEPAQFAGYDALRIYGHWINKELGGGVGGAFQTYAFWHEATQRAYLVDSIVYFPDGEKLPVLLELSMISASIAVK